MNLNSSELDEQFSEFLNGIFTDTTDSLTLSELVDQLTSFVPDPHCCLLLLYKYAGDKIKCQNVANSTFYENSLDINAREFVPEKVTSPEFKLASTPFLV